MTPKSNFYLPIINALESSTNLLEIQKKLGISKQNLNFYLRQMKKKGLISQKGRGWYEVVKEVKNRLEYGTLLPQDFIRGHGYVWSINFPQEIKGWDNRIEKLRESNINFVLVGYKKNIPRIKILGRKVWLCNNHIRVFDKAKASYYGENAIESRKQALNEISLIVEALVKKLGVSIRLLDIEIQKEHFALIRNDLAIDHNKKGEQIHIKDKFGEWLLIDDSLGEGGELENTGKKAFTTNLQMSKWWNDNKNHNFSVTPSFILEAFNKQAGLQQIFSENMQSHIEAIKKLGDGVEELTKRVKELKNE